MKEKDIPNPSELTTRSVNPKLDRGDIIMPDGPPINEGPPNSEPPDRNSPGIAERLAILEKEMAKHQLERRLAVEGTEHEFVNAIFDSETEKLWSRAGLLPDEVGSLFGRVLNRKEEEERVARNIKARQEAGEPIYVPQSLEELAKLVMLRATPEYRKGGDKYLFKEDGSVNTVHFLSWARDNYIHTHLSNPTAEVNFFSDLATNVKTEGFGSTISFYEITYTESYFLKEKRINGEIVRDENGNIVYEENADYKALREQMLMEVFLLQLQRNPAVMYILQSRAEQEKMINAVAAANVLNPITRSNFLEMILSQPSMEAKSIRDFDPSIEGEELKAKIEANFAMGTATREVLAAYINISDYKMLAEILGADAPLFQYMYEEYVAWTGKRDKEGKMLKTAKDVKGFENLDKRKKDWFKRDGKTLKLYEVETTGRNKGRYKKDADGKYIEDPNGQPHPEFMRYLNIFLTPTPDQRQQDEIRERIRLSVMKRNGISYREAQIAELMAYSMSYINGVAGRNDTDSVAFDWWTRVTNFLDKRKREKSPTRNAPYGSEFNMEGLKRIGLNFFEAARDIRGRSIRKIIQGGEGRDVHIQDNPLKNTVDYERDTKGRIIFVDKDKKTVILEAYDYKIFNDTAFEVDNNGETVQKFSSWRIFTDKSGNIIDVGDATPKEVTIEKISEPIQFDQDIQKQFLPNHLLTASKIYEWIFEQAGFNFPEMIIGYDARGNAIPDWKKINEIKGGIEHHMRYMISTWGKINFAERHVEWERVEERNERGGLIARIRNADGNEVDVDIDDEWYILKNGRRTNERADPKTFLRSSEMSRLESMFGAPALVYIQEEIAKRGLNSKNTDIITVRDENTGEEIRVNISAASGDPKLIEEFRIAVWLGAFEYLVAAEIEAHRTPGSGYRRYNYEDGSNLKDAIILGGILEPAQIGFISNEKDFGNGKLFAEQFAYDFTSGGSEGALKALALLIKSTVAE